MTKSNMTTAQTKSIISKLLEFKVNRMRNDRFWKDNLSYHLTYDEVVELKAAVTLFDVTFDSNGIPKKIFGISLIYDHSTD